LHLHRGQRAPESRDREGAGALRHRPRQVRVLRLLRGGVPGGRDPHGHRHPRVLLLQPLRDDLRQADAPGPRSGEAGWLAGLPGSDSGGSADLMEIPGFVLLAVLVVGSALGVILLRNPIHSALFLTINLAGVAALYLMLKAQFLALIQVIVYAGAIAVLFVFAIMVLIPGKEETGPDPLRGQRLLSVPVVGVFLALVAVVVGSASLSGSPKPPVPGGADAVGRVLFTDYLFPFEVTSVL